MKLIITNHVTNRDFNDKFNKEDFIVLIKKIIERFRLIKEENGFYKFKNKSVSIVIKKEVEEYTLITLFANHNEYLMPNINLTTFKGYYLGLDQDNRKTLKTLKYRTPKKSAGMEKGIKNLPLNRQEKIKKNLLKEKFKSKIENPTEFLYRKITNPVLLARFPKAFKIAKPSRRSTEIVGYLLDTKGDIVLKFSIYQLTHLYEDREITIID